MEYNHWNEWEKDRHETKTGSMWLLGNVKSFALIPLAEKNLHGYIDLRRRKKETFYQKRIKYFNFES